MIIRRSASFYSVEAALLFQSPAYPRAKCGKLR